MCGVKIELCKWLGTTAFRMINTCFYKKLDYLISVYEILSISP